MFLLILAGWAVSMVSGLRWARIWTILLTGMTTLLFAAYYAPLLVSWIGWLQLAVLVLGPWFLDREQHRSMQHLKHRQHQQAERMMRLSESARSLLSLEASTQQLDRQIAELTELYHVTKETSRALHAQELFVALLDLAPRMLRVKGLRLLDLSGASPHFFRASLGEQGRLVFVNHGAPEATEAILAEQVRGLSAQAPHGQGVFRDQAVQGLAWAVLWQEQRPIGALIAEDLQAPQERTFMVICNQLSLQLSRVRLYQQVEALAVTDALTGLFVRRHFLERAEEELERSRRHGLSCALIMMDLDHFKEKNDTYGHLVGDVVLRSVSQLLQQHLRDVDLMARYGGEEFVLLLIETNADQGMPIAQRLRQLVEVHPIQAYDELLTQTISAGMAAYPEHASTLHELIEQADRALLAAKRSGRNKVMLAER